MSLSAIRCKAVPSDIKLKNFDVIGNLEICFLWNEKTLRNDILLLKNVRFILRKYNCEILIKAGFICDGGSVPEFQWDDVSSPYATRFLLPFILHDALYAAELFTRSECDWIFLEIMQEFGCSWYRRNKAWLGVRAGGWYVWNRHKKTDIEKAKLLIKKYEIKK
jgi:hypothetical protein